MNQELISERLARAGLKVTVAENGREGVVITTSRARNGIKPFDLIFMDIYMPVMGGLEATAEIAKLNTGTPVIAISANSNPDEKKNYLVNGMSGYMNKPFTSREMTDCLMKYLKPRTGEAAACVEDKTPSRRESLSEERLKTKLIITFVNNNKSVYQEIVQAIDAGDIKLAHRLAHTLKSNAGTLGKAHLQKVAENVENLLINEKNRVNEPALKMLKKELDAVLGELAPLAAQENPSPEEKPAVSLGAEEIDALFVELEALLEGGSTECLQLIGSLSLIPKRGEDSINGDLINELIRQIEYFEFCKAMETFARIKRNRAGKRL
jgi:CheY-like chemotaxis protein